MRRKLIFGSAFIFVLALSAGFYLYQKPAERTVKGKAEYTVDAVTIFEEFDKNEGAANEKYLNKVVSVRGVVTEVSAVDSVGISALLETANPLFGVSCQFPSGNDGKSLKRGDRVKIKGLCTGKLMDVVLIKCVIEDK